LFQQEVATLAPQGIETTARFSDPQVLSDFMALEPFYDAWYTKFGQACLTRHGDSLKYVGTAATVRDMVAIADIVDGPDKPINYWGFSYGTG
jgi:hypothetical protein